MIPKGSEGVGHLSTRIMADLLPKAADAYMGADLAMLASLVDMVGEDFDRAADVLVRDGEDIRAIFREALPHTQDQALTTRMTAALETRPASLRVRDLSAWADDDLRLLIELHAAVETAQAEGAPWAAALDRTIWTFLDAYVARRSYASSF